MCGICGVVDLDRTGDSDAAAAMIGVLRHRGPDGDGVVSGDGFALGASRLAIVDLSPAGSQPFESDDGRHVLVYNGEVYNYRELRRELERSHHFRSETDTEVVLAAYRAWGEDCLDRFNGMFAFAIWDRIERRLFAARDRFGVKPFYYRQDGGRFAFASEPKSFTGLARLEPNFAVTRAYLELGHADHTVETFFAGIRRLPPSHSLVLDADGLQIRRWWSLEPSDPPADSAQRFRELFLDAVALRLRSDVPVGSCLSGGLDSSAVVTAIAHLLRHEPATAASVGERQRTFTAWFNGSRLDERPYARLVVDAAGAAPTWVTFTAADLLAALPTIVRDQDEPFGSTSVAAQWHVMKAARAAGVTVLLDGQGADELLGGYPAYLGDRFVDLLLRLRLRELAGEVRGLRAIGGLRGRSLAAIAARPFLPSTVERVLRARSARGLAGPQLRGAGSLEGDPAAGASGRMRRRSEMLLFGRGLPELLRYEDRNSMAHSVEARLPFLDYRLAELVFSLDGEGLVEAGRTKSLLRRALADVLPPPVRTRTDKIGFATPEGQWLARELGDFASQIYREPETAARGLVDPEAARRLVQRARAGDGRAAAPVWRALNVELWARAWFDR